MASLHLAVSHHLNWCRPPSWPHQIHRSTTAANLHYTLGRPRWLLIPVRSLRRCRNGLGGPSFLDLALLWPTISKNQTLSNGLCHHHDDRPRWVKTLPWRPLPFGCYCRLVHRRRMVDPLHQLLQSLCQWQTLIGKRIYRQQINSIIDKAKDIAKPGDVFFVAVIISFLHFFY